MAWIGQRGSAWRVIVREGGVRMSRTFDTEADARNWYAGIKIKIAAGYVPPPTVAPAPIAAVATYAHTNEMTVAQLFDRHMEEVSQYRKGWKNERNRFLRLQSYKEFQVPISQLRPAHVEAWTARRLTIVSSAAVLRELTTMSAAVSRAMKLTDDERRLNLTKNPFTAFTWPKPPQPRERRVTDAERAAIAGALGWDQISRPQTKRQFVAWTHAFALETMMRGCEILSATWADVLPKKLIIHPKNSKNGHGREVPLTRPARDLLALLPRGKPDERLVKMNLGTRSNLFRVAVKTAGLKNMHFHDSRREAITRAVPALPNVLDLAKASGHRNVKMLLDVYYAPKAEDIADMIDAKRASAGVPAA